MRSYCALLGLAALLCGCSAPTISAESDAAAASNGEPLVRTSDLRADGDLALVFGNRRVKVGMQGDRADDLFNEQRPAKSFDVRDLPVGFGDRFKAIGWDSAKGGYGLILQEGLVAIAVRTVSELSESDIEEAVAAYRDEYRSMTPTEVTGRTCHYWFFQESSRRLMICSAKNRKGDWTLTLAVGHVAYMDQLRMSVDAAKEDAAQAASEDAKP